MDKVTVIVQVLSASGEELMRTAVPTTVENVQDPGKATPGLRPVVEFLQHVVGNL